MKSQFLPCVLYFIASIFGAVGQYFYKVGSKHLTEVSIFQNYSLWIGVLSFCFVMVLFVAGFRLGGRLSVVYPIYATTFIWATLIAVYKENESVNLVQAAGIFVIVVGVSLIALGSKTPA